MTVITNIVNEILKILENDYNIFINIVNNIVDNYINYCFFINSQYNLLSLFEKISNRKQFREKILLINKKIQKYTLENNIKDIILFLNILKNLIYNLLNKKIYIPEKLNKTTKNNLISFIEKDLNEKNIVVIEKSIDNFNIDKIVYVLLPNVLVTYSISCFLIKIIKKDLDITHE